MKAYTRNVEIRWSDLDPNWHVANSAIAQFFIHGRVGYLESIGADSRKLESLQLGPVLLQENFYYLKEIHASDKQVEVKIMNGGYSEDGRFYKLDQELHTTRSGLSVYSSVLFVWMNLITRKIDKLPEEFFHKFQELEQSSDFKILDKSAISLPDFLKRNR